MNLVLFSEKDFVGGAGKIRLEGRRHKHISDIHKVKVGDNLIVGMIGGKIGNGRVTSLDKKFVEMEVLLDSSPPDKVPIVLILALPRPIMLKRILLAVSSMGLKRIILINSNRVEKSFWRSNFLVKEKIEEQLVLGLEQAKDTIMPEVIMRDRFKPFVEDELPGMIKGTIPIVAHPGAGAECPRNVKFPVTLVVGPEGGFVSHEIEKFESIGFKIVHFGERILRVDSAIPFLVSRFL